MQIINLIRSECKGHNLIFGTSYCCGDDFIEPRLANTLFLNFFSNDYFFQMYYLNAPKIYFH